MKADPRRAIAVWVLGLLLVLLLPALGLAEAREPIAPGTTYQHIYRAEGPWAIHVVEADLSQEYLELGALLGGGTAMKRSGVREATAAGATEERRPVAAVNGDFFALGGGDYAAIPLGFNVLGGELVTLPEPSRSVLYVLRDGTAHIGKFRANAWLHGAGDLLFPLSAVNRPPAYSDLVLFTPRFGEETRAHEDTTQIVLVGLSGPVQPNVELTAKIASIAVTERQPIPREGAVLAARGVAAYALRDLKVGDEVNMRFRLEPRVGEIREAVGGGPRLVRDGKASVEHLQERFAGSFAARRHPRTAVGVRDGTVVLVTVDGRQPGYSEGMTLDELAGLLVELGCTEAMNLDGGGSTTMVVRDRVMNSPSSGVPRAVANALALFTTAPVGPPTRLCVEPSEVHLLAGQQITLEATALDEYHNPVPVDPEEIGWDCAPVLGEVDDDGVFIAALVPGEMMGIVTARWGGLAAVLLVRVAPAPPRVLVIPEEATVLPAEEQQFVAKAYDHANQPLALPEDWVEWSCEPEDMGARIGPTGVLQAPARAGKLTVKATVGEVSGEAQVAVGAPFVMLQDFEQPDGLPGQGWRYRGQPELVTGEVAWMEDPLRPGNHCLLLRYDFTPTGGTRAAYVDLDMELPEAETVSLSALGDGKGAWLRARLRDAVGRAFPVDLADRLDWSGEWRRLSATLPEKAVAPVTLESVYVVEYHADRKPAGAVFLDDIGVECKGGGDAMMSELPSYLCRRTEAPIVVDGHLREPVWSRVAPMGDFRAVAGTAEPQLPTEVRACWDEENLYLAFVCVDTDIWGTMRSRDDPIYEEEVVEAFLCSGDDVTHYYEFEFSPHNVVFDAAIDCPESGDRRFMKMDPTWNCEGLRSEVEVVGTLDDDSDVDERWTVEVALPFSQIGRQGRPPVEGERWRANFYRIDRAGEGELSCWSPTLADPPDFHVPRRFGYLVFSEGAA